MRLVVAVGGNALLPRGEPPDAAVQQHHVRTAARSLAPLTVEHELVLLHGNGPQVGLLAEESSADPALSSPYPLDVLVAQTQGMIGYWFLQALRGVGVQRRVLAVLTQTVVSGTDPAFGPPPSRWGRRCRRPTPCGWGNATGGRWVGSATGGGGWWPRPNR